MSTEFNLDELYEKSKNLLEGEVILDVRTPVEFSEGHIEGAKNISHDEVLGHVDDLKGFKKVYIHCKMGGRAKMAGEMLEDAGLTNIIMVCDAGMVAWVERGYPTI
jgi:phage shock protein E